MLGQHTLFFVKETENLEKFNHYIAINYFIRQVTTLPTHAGLVYVQTKMNFLSKETIKNNNMKNKFLLESHRLNLQKKGLLSHSSKRWNSEITNSFIIIAGNNLMLTFCRCITQKHNEC